MFPLGTDSRTVDIVLQLNSWFISKRGAQSGAKPDCGRGDKWQADELSWSWKKPLVGVTEFFHVLLSPDDDDDDAGLCTECLVFSKVVAGALRSPELEVLSSISASGL